MRLIIHCSIKEQQLLFRNTGEGEIEIREWREDVNRRHIVEIKMRDRKIWKVKT